MIYWLNIDEISVKHRFKISVSIGLFLYEDTQIHQIHVRSKILKSLKLLPFDSLIENRKFQNFQLHNPSGSDLMAILIIFPTEFEGKM